MQTPQNPFHAHAEHSSNKPSHKKQPHKHRPVRWLLLLAGLGMAGTAALALKPVAVSPQGEVARVRQFLVKFDKEAVTAGNATAPAPFALKCTSGSGQKVAIPTYSGTWRNATTWAADFDDFLPPDVRCTAQSTAGFKSPKGEALEASTLQFKTGAPFITDITPGGTIAEDQAFIVRFNGAVDTSSVQANARCRIEGVGEQVPVQVITGDERQAILKTRWNYKTIEKSPEQYVLLRCNRTLPSDSKVELFFGGYRGAGGLINNNPQSFSFKVQSPLEASFSCERPNAQAACMPIRPVTLNFSAPVPMQWAKQVVLQYGKETIKPQFSADEANSSSTESVRFAGNLPEQAAMQIVLPAGLVDDAGRTLSNASSFPLAVRTGPMPPLVKFAAAPFGVVERFAEGPKGPALLPVTLRKVESALQAKSLIPGGTVRDLSPQTDAEIIRWYQHMMRLRYDTVSRADAKAMGIRKLPAPIPAPPKGSEDEEGTWRIDDKEVETRMISVLEGTQASAPIALPTSSASERPFEVLGIALQPGFHVVEIASPMLGQSLLDTRYQGSRNMFVRTSALVTNLGVHLKRGRTDSLIWVTALDTGKPVPHASVAISNSKGQVIASGKTDDKGIWLYPNPLPVMSNDEDEDDYTRALFISARATDKNGDTDMAFVWSNWNRGIESWRFNVPTSDEILPSNVAHSVLDRTLLRAGETVSMKHFVRTESPKGLTATTHAAPAIMRITHQGSDQSFDVPISWRNSRTGSQSAESQWQIPKDAKLGMYTISLIGKDAKGEDVELSSSNFRVEEFRLPTMRGSITPVDKNTLIGITNLPVQVQLAYINGGAASGLPVKISASARPGYVSMQGYDEFSFSRSSRHSGSDDDSSDESESGDSESKPRLLADQLELKLGKDGAGQITIGNIAPSQRPINITLEASYSDPNGEIQTLQSSRRIWPAGVVVGIKADDWLSMRDTAKMQLLALDVNGKPKAGVKLQARAILHTTVSSRKRLVGGFYAYDNQQSSKDLGNVCSGNSDSRGLLLCNANITEPGEVELVVTASDEAGRKAEASTTITVVSEEQLWFGGNDSDRMDVLPEKHDYKPGEVAKLQVRMPFRQATALLTVEREGILHSEVITLNGQDPTVELKIRPEWGPNVYVNVMALRGRLRDVPWYSFFTWGYKAPLEWWRAFRYEGKDYTAPTAMVDLSKPAFRVGMAAINVGVEDRALQVNVRADRESYQVRQQAQVTIEAKLPNGQPAAFAEVAVAAVDEALLELRSNSTWDALHAMYRTRPWGVETATAQMEIIGRRHYGMKATPAGGDGGQGNNTRELLDTLLLWQPNVQLDANGQAKITVPINDALTSFRIVAVASSGADLFGTGQTSIRTTQDLQIISGLPPLVREGDQYRAQITLRNTTKKDMQVQVAPRATLLTLQAQTVAIPAGDAREVVWDVTAPAQLAFTREPEIVWEISAKDSAGSNASDTLKVAQRIIPAIPLTVQQAALVQVSGSASLNLAPPPQSLPLPDGKAARGGVKVSLQPTLADGLPGVRDWFANYPYTCMEQRATRAIGLRDKQLWQSIVAELPNFLDADGLPSYFPPQSGSAARGSDTLAAYLLAATHEAGTLNPTWRLPAPVRDAMLAGLTKFVEGKIERKFWAPRPDRDVRKLAALEALSRYGRVRANMLGSIQINPNTWPTHAVIDWYNILQRTPALPERAAQLEEASQILRSRLNMQGTRLSFSSEQDDYWWWLMQNGDVNSARLILAVIDNPAWRADMGALASGFIARQQGGAWHTTTANLWGGLALEKFSAKFESTPVAGTTSLRMGAKSETIDWSKATRLPATAQPHRNQWFGAPASVGMYTNNSANLPWQNAPGGKPEQLLLQQQGSGKPWATVQAIAAVPLTAPVAAGYGVKKTITPVQQAQAGKTSRGDVWRVSIDINASADMTWVVLSDPIPSGATILGSGLGRDSALATAGESSGGNGWLAFVERSFEAYRAYYEYLPQGKTRIEYNVRLNNVGDFSLPPTRVEALYAPEVFGAAPNSKVKVEPRP